MALELFSKLQLYAPNSNDEDRERDVQCKYSIQKTDSNVLASKNSKESPRYKRFTRFFQCQCGIDHTAGRLAGKKRQIPWKNVGCLSWVKLVTTHDENNGSPPFYLKKSR